MEGYGRSGWVSLFVMSLLILFMAAGSTVAAEPKLEVVPEQAALTADLVKTPLQFKCSGFKPKEMVVIELQVPKGLKLKGLAEDETAAGLAFGNADDQGNMQLTMGAGTVLNWLLQVGWGADMKPDFNQAKPLPPGKYEITASGMDSGGLGKAIFTVLPPPPPAEKK